MLIVAVKLIFQKSYYGLPLPLLAFALLAIMETCLRLINPVPVSPWDAAAIVEADRVAQGLALYEHWHTGHSSWTYGPGMLWIGGAIFKVFGAATLPLKIVSLLFTAGTIILCSMVVWKQLPAFWRFTALLSFIAVDGRVAYFGVIRPDSIAYFFAFASLMLSYRAGTAKSLIASILLVCAVLSKQTALMFAIIPPIAILITRDVNFMKRLALATLPGVSCVIALLLLFYWSPDAWMYMVEEGRHYPVSLRDLLKNGLAFMTGAAMLWIIAATYAVREVEVDSERRHQLIWLIVTFAVSFIGCTAALSKGGGWINSLAPLYFIMLVLTWFCAAPLLQHRPGRAQNANFATLLVAAMTLTLVPTWPSFDPIRLARSSAATDYDQVIATVRRLDGIAISPFDPTITLYARDQHDGSVILSMDTIGWPSSLPKSLLDHAYSAEYIVQKRRIQGDGILRLPERGYHEVWRNQSYSIWRASKKYDSPARG